MPTGGRRFPTWPDLQRLAARPEERRRWRLSQLLQCHPFHPDLLGLTDLQIDWIVAQYDLDYPEPPADRVKARYDALVSQLRKEAGA
jgi:hypothetical protein